MVDLVMPYFRVTQLEDPGGTYKLEVFSQGKVVATRLHPRQLLIEKIREFTMKGLVNVEVTLEKMYPMPAHIPGEEESGILQGGMPPETLPSVADSADGLGDGIDRAERPRPGGGPIRNPVGRPGKSHKPKNKGKGK